MRFRRHRPLATPLYAASAIGAALPRCCRRAATRAATCARKAPQAQRRRVCAARLPPDFAAQQPHARSARCHAARLMPRRF